MELIWTDQAIQEREKRVGENSLGRASYKLVYDTEGCGCVNNGVFFLSVVSGLENGDIEIRTNDEPVYAESRFAVYLNEKMSIDYSETAGSFQLKSPEQMLNPRMAFKK